MLDARRRIRIASPVLTSGPILATLVEIVNEHRCDVAGVIDETQVDEVFHQWASNGVSAWKIPLLHTVLTSAPFAGKPTIPWTPESLHNFMHAKVVVADDVTFVGSFNFSRSGERNAENVLEIHDPAVADELATFIDRVRALIPTDDAAPVRGLSTGRPAEKGMMRIVLAAAVAVAAIAATRLGASPLPTAKSCSPLPGRQPLESPRRHAAGGSRISSDDRRDRAGEDDARRLRLGALGRRPDRDPDHGRRQGPGEERGPVRLRGRVRPGAVPDPRGREDRGRAELGRRPARPHRRPRRLPPLRAVRAAPRRVAAGRRGRARSGTCARTGCARPAGRRPTRPGLPILPGLARYDEVAKGRIDHALRFTVSRTRRAYVWPARHFASSLTDPALPPMGARLRLKAELRHLGLSPAGARRPPGAEAVRDDRRRQRLGLVRLGRPGPALVERRPAHARPRAGFGLRGRRHERRCRLTPATGPRAADKRDMRLLAAILAVPVLLRRLAVVERPRDRSAAATDRPRHLRPLTSPSTARASGATCWTRRDGRARCSSTPPESRSARLFLTRSTCGRLRSFAGHSPSRGARLPRTGRLAGARSTAVRLLLLRRRSPTRSTPSSSSRTRATTRSASATRRRPTATRSRRWRGRRCSSARRPGGRAARARDGGARAEAGRAVRDDRVPRRRDRSISTRRRLTSRPSIRSRRRSVQEGLPALLARA